MGKPAKPVEQKLNTRLDKLRNEPRFSVTLKTVKVDNKVLFTYSRQEIKYSTNRFFPSKKEDLTEEDFRVSIPLTHQTLKILGTSIWNPPRGAGIIIDQFRKYVQSIDHIIIGANEDKIEGSNLYITIPLYQTLLAINTEEGKDKIVRVQNRIAPFLESKYSLQVGNYALDRNYSLLLDELLASKNITQADAIKLTDILENGENNRIVIEKQINKQAEWLLDAMQEIVDTEELSTTVAKDLGHRLFGYPKVKINGPEGLMEKILTDYGKNIIFGVPYLLNTDKYVVSSNALSRSQFDLILVNLLSDIELIELKRPDEYLLSYNASRGKFYVSKDLSMAIAQAERYVSAILRDNDSEYKMDGKTIRKFIEEQVGGTVTLSVCRPTALVIIGRIQSLIVPYEKLSIKAKRSVTKEQYNKNAEQAYQELKGSYRNIQITTYSELIETARLRLQQKD
jgi:hypothetical protein